MRMLRGCRQCLPHSNLYPDFTTALLQTAAYMQLRRGQHQAAITAQAAAASAEPPPIGDHALMSQALFATLPQLLARLCPCPASRRTLDLRLFNEHYVVKVTFHNCDPKASSSGPPP